MCRADPAPRLATQHGPAQQSTGEWDLMTADALRGPVEITLRVNGTDHSLLIEPRVTLLDALRESIGLTGAKKGCDRGECGACTVHVDGRRVNSCVTLAVMQAGHDITTIEGLGSTVQGRSVQRSFVACDGFQCGFCTPGQVMSAVACIAEGHAGGDEEVREWMSGNICRCGAYPQIVKAVLDAAEAVEVSRA
jgi:xanthine dehydrogenase YagT iron-sulfur-binding subunit